MFGDDVRKLVYLVVDELKTRGAVTMQYVSDGFSRKAHVHLNGYNFTMARVKVAQIKKAIREAIEKYYGKLEPQETLNNYKILANYKVFLAENSYKKVENGTVLEVLEIEAVRK